MTRYAMSIDLDRCVGCQACAVACKAENEVPDPLFRLTVSEQAGAGAKALVTFAHAQCFHCEEPACVALCPTGATFKDANGVVRLDSETCINCGYCVSACPYAARHFDASAGAVQKCDFCALRLENHLLPACVDVCPTEARLFGDLDQPDTAFSKAASAREARVFRPELGLKPKLFYVAKNDKMTDLAMNALPARTPTPLLASLWSGVTRPLSGFGTVLAAAVTLLAFPVAWRNARMHEKGGAGEGAAPTEPGQPMGEVAKTQLAAIGREKASLGGAGATAGQRPAIPGQKAAVPRAADGNRPTGAPGGTTAGQRPALPAKAPAKRPSARREERHGHR
jgi:Fe-S-cluster-containing dehydrogenase component